MQVRVVDRQRRLRVARNALRTIARATLAGDDRGAPGGRRGSGYDEIGITLLGDEAMRELNRAFRGLDRTTDVLAFDLRAGGAMSAPGEPRCGEVVISTDRVLVQARRYRVTAGRELARLAVHGLLHLQGFDHQRAGERRRMRAAERCLLAGIAPAIARLVPERAHRPLR
jgi:probable rRNA maturation factor